MKIMKYLVALLITAGCLYVAFKGVDLGRAWQIITSGERIRILPLAGFCAFSLAVMWVRGWRWKYLYKPEHHATTNGLATANLIGFTTNNILPLRIGEAVRAIVARRKVDAPISYILASLLIERIFDSICVLLCLMIPLTYAAGFAPSMPKIPGALNYVLAGSILFLILLLMVLGLFPHSAEKTVVKLTGLFMPARFREKVQVFMGMFSEGIKILRKRDVLLKVSVLSIIHWGMVVFSYWLMLAGFSFDSLPWIAPFFTLGMVGLGVALPSAPAFVGPIHWAIIYSLSSGFGLPNDEAAAFAVVMHILMMAPVTVAGLIAMAREGVTLGQLRKGAEHFDDKPDPASSNAVQAG
jgi:glycosyltransferase 2 family protein